MSKITVRELKVIFNIAENVVQPLKGEEPETLDDVTAIWSNDIVGGPEEIDPQVIPSVVKALRKKNMVIVEGTGNSEMTSLTELGFDIYKQSKKMQ